jgi:chromosome segregation ATPase
MGSFPLALVSEPEPATEGADSSERHIPPSPLIDDAAVAERAALDSRAQDLRRELRRVVDEIPKLEAGLRQHKAALERKLLDFSQKTEADFLQRQVGVEAQCVALEDELSTVLDAQFEIVKRFDQGYRTQKLSLLEEIFSTEQRISDELDRLIEIERINCQTAWQSIGILNRRLETAGVVRGQHEHAIVEVEAQIRALEQELTAKRPQWKAVSKLREKERSLNQQATQLHQEVQCKASEFEAMAEIWGSATTVPFLNVLAVFLRIQSKIDLLELNPLQKEELLYLCDLFGLVFGGFQKAEAQSETLLCELQRLEKQLEGGAFPSLTVFFSLLQSVSSIPLNQALSPHFLRLEALRTQKQELRQLADRLPTVLHPVLLRGEGVAFATVVPRLKADLADGKAMGTYCDAIGTFVDDRIEPFDLFDRFFEAVQQEEQETKAKEPQSGRNERKELEGRLQALDTAMEGEKKRFEELSREVADQINDLRELERSLADACEQMGGSAFSDLD